MYKNYSASIIVRLDELRSNNMIAVTNITHNKTELIASDIIASAEVFDGLDLPFTPLTLTSTTFTPINISLNIFVTFSNRTFSYMDPSLPMSVSVEAPCSFNASAFSYTFSPALPSWLTYTPTGLTST